MGEGNARVMERFPAGSLLVALKDPVPKTSERELYSYPRKEGTLFVNPVNGLGQSIIKRVEQEVALSKTPEPESTILRLEADNFTDKKR